MDRFLDAYNEPKDIQEHINHLDRSITSNESDAVMKSLPKKKNPGPNGLIAEF
jgi:hypothetical protein